LRLWHPRYTARTKLGVPMIKLIFSILVSLLAFTTINAHAEIGVNIQLQQDQIVSDAKTGMMKMVDANSAMEYLNQIKFEYKRAKSDGHINDYERRLLNEMLMRNAQAIYRYRANRLK
jgi:hypothetical protein